jgi:hypothetical protein
MDEIIKSIVTGGLLILIGLVFIFFHEELRRMNDAINRKVFGDLWSGVYAVEVVLLIRAVHTVTGLLLVMFGSGIVVSILEQ